MTQYTARQCCPEFRLSSDEAQKIGEELERITGSKDPDKMGAKARAIVEDARNNRSFLHPYLFGKSDRELADDKRLDLARKLINSIRIVFVEDDGSRSTMAPLVMVKPDPKSDARYVPIGRALDSEYMTAQRVEAAIHRLNGWLDEFRPFRHAIGLKPIWDGVRAVLVHEGKVDDQTKREEKIKSAPSKRAAARSPSKHGSASHRAAPHRTAPLRPASPSSAPGHHEVNP